MSSDEVADHANDPGQPGWHRVAQLARAFATSAPGRSAGVVCRSLRLRFCENAKDQRSAAGVVRTLMVVAATYACDRDGRVSLDHDFLRRDSILPPDRHSVLTAFTSEHRFSIRELCSLAVITGDEAVLEFLLFYVGRSSAVDGALHDLGMDHTRFGADDAVTTVEDVLHLVQLMSRQRHFQRPVRDLQALTLRAWTESTRHLARPDVHILADLPLGHIYVLGDRPAVIGVLLCNNLWASSVARREVDQLIDVLGRQARGLGFPHPTSLAGLVGAKPQPEPRADAPSAPYLKLMLGTASPDPQSSRHRWPNLPWEETADPIDEIRRS